MVQVRRKLGGAAAAGDVVTTQQLAAQIRRTDQRSEDGIVTAPFPGWAIVDVIATGAADNTCRSPISHGPSTRAAAFGASGRGRRLDEWWRACGLRRIGKNLHSSVI
jgi:hypothetical protein